MLQLRRARLDHLIQLLTRTPQDFLRNLAIAFLFIGKVVAVPHILGHLSLSPAHALEFPVTALILLAMGLGIGALGSGLTIRRFLRV